MAGFLYFLPGAASANARILQTAGLADVLTGATLDTRGVSGSGPSGSQGIMLAPKLGGSFFGPPPPSLGTMPKIGYFRETQEWQEAPGGKYWLGRETAEPVLPADLARNEMIGGHLVKLADEKQWLIPVARAFPHGIVLPQALRLGPDGELVGDTLPKYIGFSKRAERLWDVWNAAMKELEAGKTPEPQLDVQEQWDITAEALAINYRINAMGMSMLGLINIGTPVLWKILQAIIDVPTILAEAAAMADDGEKKKDEPVAPPEGSPTSSGPEA